MEDGCRWAVAFLMKCILIVQDLGSPIVCPTTMMRTMKTARSTRIQHIATATIVCFAPLTAAERPCDHPTPSHHDPKRDEILIWWPLALVNGQSYKCDPTQLFIGPTHAMHVNATLLKLSALIFNTPMGKDLNMQHYCYW